MLNEISQTQKDKYYMIPLVWGTWNSQNHKRQKTEEWLPGAGSLGSGELLFNGDGVSVWDNEEGLEINSSDSGGCIAMWMYLMPMNCIMVKIINFSYVYFTTKKPTIGNIHLLFQSNLLYFYQYYMPIYLALLLYIFN